MNEHIAKRRVRAAKALAERGIDAFLLTPSSDLTYLSGYRIFPSERLTCLVLTARGEAKLLVPVLEAPRARAAQTGIPLVTWSETEDPIARVREFRDLLKNLGANATVRQNRGTSIDAACGQLRATAVQIS